jgi:hypothetical protein
MSQTRQPDAGAHAGAHALAEAERLIAEAEADPTQARPAAVAALRALLLYWAEEPRGESVAELLAQAAQGDSTLDQFRVMAEDLDAKPGEYDAYERATVFVDAARGRLTGD